MTTDGARAERYAVVTDVGRVPVVDVEVGGAVRLLDGS
jgi:hypothetical protein